MIRLYFTLLVWLCTCIAIEAQNFKPPATGAGIIYNTERTINLKVTTNRGVGLGMEFGRLQTYYKTTYFHANIGDLRHQKEQRQTSAPTINRTFRPFIYGKRNSLFALRAGWGVKRYYSEKARQRGVAMGISYTLGPTLGILKPYYVALRRAGDTPGQSRIQNEKYSLENADIFLDNTRILGASGFTKGFSELSLLPGGNATLALHMDWGAFDELVKAFEIGIMVDAFVKKAPILVADSQNRRTFVNFFVNMQFGKRK